MAPKKKIEAYEDQQYQQKKDALSSLAQCFQDLKFDRNSTHTWNKALADVEGVTMKAVGDTVSLVAHKIVTGTVETIQKDEGPRGKAFLKEVEKELKKRFKKMTGKDLELKKIKEEQQVEKYSVLQADTSWMVGSSRNGYHGNPICKFIVRDFITYQLGL
jgi:hypothetical protein